MPEVTVTGGLGKPPHHLRYDASDKAFHQAKAFASIIDAVYGNQTATEYKPGMTPPTGGSPGYLIIPHKFANGRIDATGFGAVVDRNHGKPSTVIGGHAAGGQTVLAADGGLTYLVGKGGGSNTVIAGGGMNYISFLGDKGKNAVWTSTGNDTIYGGIGHTRISAGSGDNQIYLDKGQSRVFSHGHDTVHLSAGGTDTIEVLKGGHDVVRGASSGPGVQLTFIGGTHASTVLGGVGSYTIFGGAGGGDFHGGSSGDNSITAGPGAATIDGGGAGDTLTGGSANDLIKASTGNETLGGGTGDNVFDLTIHHIHGTAGAGTTDTITDFSQGTTTQDLLNVGGTHAINLALHSYSVTPSGGTFSLEDGTKVVLQGFTGSLTSSDFKH